MCIGVGTHVCRCVRADVTHTCTNMYHMLQVGHLKSSMCCGVFGDGRNNDMEQWTDIGSHTHTVKLDQDIKPDHHPSPTIIIII